MPQFHLHRRDNSGTTNDSLCGDDYEELEGAINDAIRSVREQMAHSAPDTRPPNGATFEICDEVGTVVARVRFAKARVQ